MQYTAKLMFLLGQRLPVDTCGCHFCDNEYRRLRSELMPDEWPPYVGSGMIVCPECGNKRCPRATYHGVNHPCTASNEPGQPGSVYGNFALDTSWMDDDDD